MPNYSMPAEHQRNVFINHAYHSHDPVSRRGGVSAAGQWASLSDQSSLTYTCLHTDEFACSIYIYTYIEVN